MKKQLLIILLFVLGITNTWAQTLVWKNSVTGTSTSANGRAPAATHKYTRTVYLVSAGELSAGGIDAGKVLKAIGFNYNAVSTTAATGTLKFYLQNTTATSYGKGTSWSTAISTMTKVSDATATIPTTATAEFTFQNGDAFTYTGGALYVAFEWLNLEGTLGTSKTALCNSSTTNTGGVDGLYSSFSTTSTSPSDNLTSNNFRPTTRFAYELLNNDTKVSNVYAMSTAPLNEGIQNISARITNEGVNPIYNLNVTLTVSGANTFTSTKAISLPVETPVESGASYIVNFDEFIPANLGSNTINVTVNVTDDEMTNNSLSRQQEVTSGLFSYTLGNTISSNGGSTAQNYRYAVKYKANGTVYPKAARFLLSTSTTVVGKELKAFWLDANMNLMGESAIYTVIPGDQGTFISIPFTASNVAVPNVSGNTEFYVGIQQTSATGGEAIYFMGTQSPLENPIKPDTYFGGSSTLTVSTTTKSTVEAVTTLSTLPVSISTFTAKLNNNKVALNWTVGTETNVNRYEIERSSNGVDFVKVAEVTANGSSSYSTVDNKPQLGINYYRLKGVDNDGTLSHFNEVRSVKIVTLEQESTLVYPNPVVGNEINVSLSGYPAESYSYKITNELGSTVQAGQISNNGSIKNSISLKAQISKGIYILYISNGKEIIQSKFIKN